MIANFSEKEREFFKKIICDYDIRTDGRDRMSSRSLQLKQDIIPSSFSSLKITLNDSQKEILIVIKGDLLKLKESESILDINFANISIESINKLEDLKIKKEIEEFINNLLLNKINKDIFFVREENNKKTNFFWKLYIDILLFDNLKISYLQIISFGIKHAMINLKLPKLIFLKNEISEISEIDLLENYKDISESEKEIQLPFDKIPDILVFSLINNSLYIDPNDEEEAISNSIIIASKINNNLESVQSIGSSVDLNRIVELTNFIKNFNV